MWRSSVFFSFRYGDNPYGHSLYAPDSELVFTFNREAYKSTPFRSLDLSRLRKCPQYRQKKYFSMSTHHQAYMFEPWSQLHKRSQLPHTWWISLRKCPWRKQTCCAECRKRLWSAKWIHRNNPEKSVSLLFKNIIAIPQITTPDNPWHKSTNSSTT